MLHGESSSFQSVDRSLVRELAVIASVDERTMWRRLRGEPVRGIASDRADRALRARGIEPGALSEAKAE
jgi:hypothetical protein